MLLNTNLHYFNFLELSQKTNHSVQQIDTQRNKKELPRLWIHDSVESDYIVPGYLESLNSDYSSQSIMGDNSTNERMTEISQLLCITCGSSASNAAASMHSPCWSEVVFVLFLSTSQSGGCVTRFVWCLTTPLSNIARYLMALFIDLQVILKRKGTLLTQNHEWKAKLKTLQTDDVWTRILHMNCFYGNNKKKSCYSLFPYGTPAWWFRDFCQSFLKVLNSVNIVDLLHRRRRCRNLKQQQKSVYYELTAFLSWSVPMLIDNMSVPLPLISVLTS